jgi:hypothetical protein
MTDIQNNSTEYFQSGEYCLGDSAYSTCFPYIITPYKKPASLIDRNKKFNYLLARARITIEHCIGIIKARFPVLSYLRERLQTDDDLEYVCRKVVACFVIHNMCISKCDTIFEDLEILSQDESQEQDQVDDNKMFVWDGAELRVCVQEQVLDSCGYS